MTRKRSAIACPREPRGLRLDESAAYLGWSPATFRKAVSEGVMPCPHEFSGVMSWDADELDEAFRKLPRRLLDLKPGVQPPHDEAVESEAERWAPPPRA